MVYTNEDIKIKLNRRKIRKKILSFLIIPIIIVLVLLCGYIGYLKLIKKTDDINIFGFRQYMVLTGSMEPNYNIGDLIIVKEKSEEEIKVGDVINYISSNGKDTITHRVVEIVKENGQTKYKTKGDNNSSIDSSLVTYDQIQGITVFKIDKIGVIITNFLTGTGAFIVLLIIVLSYIFSNKAEEKRIAREDARRIYNIPKYKKEDII